LSSCRELLIHPIGTSKIPGDSSVHPYLHLQARCSLHLVDLARSPSLVAPRFKRAIEAIIHRVDLPLFILFNSHNHEYFPSGEWVIKIGWIMYFLLKKTVFQGSEAQSVLLITEQERLDQGNPSVQFLLEKNPLVFPIFSGPGPPG
jgi:hypothetical protein